MTFDGSLDERMDRALADLRDCADRSREERRELERELTAVRERERQAASRIETLESELERERADAACLRDRLRTLREHTLELHRALFEGDLHDLLLRASIALTGARRGGYFEVNPAADGEAVPHLLTELDIDLEEGEPIPREMQAIVERCLQEERSVLQNDPASEGGSTYDSLLAAPVSLTGELDGAVVVADKPGGFAEEDAHSLISIGDQATLAADNRRLHERLRKVHLEMIGMLADLAESKDPYTSGHCEQVAGLALRLGRRLGLKQDDLRTICYAALLHDVGKVAVSDVILKKREPLLAEEMELVRSHVRIGHGLLNRIPLLTGVADGVLYHHERWDGGGYPEGLAGDAIPITARVVCVADAYCAMLDERVYKHAMSPAEAKAELQRCSGTQFDPQVVEVFLELLEEDGPDPSVEVDSCGVPPGLALRRERAGEDERRRA